MAKLVLAFALLVGLMLVAPDRTLQYLGPHVQSVGQQLRTVLDINRIIPAFGRFGRG